ncbi:DUF1615 domain-containing protein [Agitococcus lubricus]|uniref:Uncharacterized protein DUF1615 n=1 Tax=Agitococcus lubricus TaxID=1077255 RepID=A0A2T5IZY5_9GAMM|nr:DUF1615 domain-containing protein [Agitococcus lubricus]PTQ89603.1 uncharacterized protein DUF1615 [Agitococcus lubricus]
MLSFLSGCATTVHVPQPAPQLSSPPTPTTVIEHVSSVSTAATPDNVISEPPPTVTPPVIISPPTVTEAPKRVDEGQAKTLLFQLLPSDIKDRQGWRDDIFTAFSHLKIPLEASYFCAAIAIIEQESSWQSDPIVPNLDNIVWKEIEKKADNYHIPMLAIKTAFLKTSPNGKSYKYRIDHLRTEKQMNDLFEDMASEAKQLGLPLGIKNPIRTGGPMQVSIEFAEGHIRVWPYPYRYKGSIRSEVFSRRGGLYFGIANLLQYRVNYPVMAYRFADFNAGRYSSRNAAFQAALAKLSAEKITLDGDLLMYKTDAMSETLQTLLALSKRLGLSRSQIERDLKLEKTEGFSQTMLYKRVFELAQQQTGRVLAQQVMPQIKLSSPKITRKLTTEWFANRVNGRFKQCMARAPDSTPL